MSELKFKKGTVKLYVGTISGKKDIIEVPAYILGKTAVYREAVKGYNKDEVTGYWTHTWTNSGPWTVGHIPSGWAIRKNLLLKADAEAVARAAEAVFPDLPADWELGDNPFTEAVSREQRTVVMNAILDCMKGRGL